MKKKIGRRLDPPHEVNAPFAPRPDGFLNARCDAVQEAIHIFGSQGGFAREQLWIRDRMKQAEQDASPQGQELCTMPRAELALTWFNIRAEAFVRLTRTSRIWLALVTMFSEFERAAWHDFCGGYPEEIRPAPTQASIWMKEQIPRARERWTRAALEQLDARHSVKRDAFQIPLCPLKLDKWESLEIQFLSDHRVQFQLGNQHHTYNYAELGFHDRRDQKPKKAWWFLLGLAKSKGEIANTSNTTDKWPVVEKRIQEIRKPLKRFFDLTEDPIPFVQGRYRARMLMSFPKSFDT